MLRLFLLPLQKNRPIKRSALPGGPILIQKRSGSSVLADYLNAVVVTAVSTDLMRCLQLAAVGALGKSRHVQLPNACASLVSSCFGYFSLGYCHV